MSFYTNAFFPAERMIDSGINLIEATLWLLGMRTVINSDEPNQEFLTALHTLELAVAMGELVATRVMTTHDRKVWESLYDVAETAADKVDLEVVINPGTSTFINPKALESWWKARNTIIEHSSESDSEMTPEKWREYVGGVLAKHNGNKTHAAKEIGISRARVGQLINNPEKTDRKPLAFSVQDPFGIAKKRASNKRSS